MQAQLTAILCFTFATGGAIGSAVAAHFIYHAPLAAIAFALLALIGAGLTAVAYGDH